MALYPLTMFSPEEKKALVLSTFAGLSTTIGALFAVSWVVPEDI